MNAALLTLGAWAAEPTPLGTAIDAGSITAELRGNGSSTGDAIFATLKSGGQELTIDVAAGTVLTAASAEAPRMVVAASKGRMLGYGWFQPSTSMTVAATGSTQWVLESYAIELGKRHPEQTDRYTVGAVDATLAALIQKADELKSGPAALQTAIWASTADFELDKLRERFPAGDETMTAARTLYEAAGHDPCAHSLWEASCSEANAP